MAESTPDAFFIFSAWPISASLGIYLSREPRSPAARARAGIVRADPRTQHGFSADVEYGTAHVAPTGY